MVVFIFVFKHTLRWIWYLTEFLLAFLFLYMDLALGLAIVPTDADEVTDGVKIYVKTNGVHTDLCLPVKHDLMDWTSYIPVTDFPQTKNQTYISIGWGDKGFFLDTPTWDDLSLSTAFNAAFLPSETAMHVQYLEYEPVVSTSVKKKLISFERYQKLIVFIQDSFRENNDGCVDLIPGKGYWSNDNFYEANGSYHLFNTCNKWTNDALKVAGIKTALLALFSDGIMRHLD